MVNIIQTKPQFANYPSHLIINTTFLENLACSFKSEQIICVDFAAFQTYDILHHRGYWVFQ